MPDIAYEDMPPLLTADFAQAKADKERLEAALRDAFPHFQNDEPITPEAIAEIGRDWSSMVVNWAPVQREIEFLDQAGNKRKLEYEVFEEPAGAAWVIPDAADWEVRKVR